MHIGSAGALFAVYWLMRLELAEVHGSLGLDGQKAFCLGVDETTWETVLPRSAGVEPAPRKGSFEPAPRKGSIASAETAKRVSFLDSHDWMQEHTLMIDAGMLVRLDNGGVEVCAERTRAMLVLTAIHDVMKIEELLPTVLVRRTCSWYMSWAEGALSSNT